MKKVTIEIETVNNAFKSDSFCETARILRSLAKQIEGCCPLPNRVLDINNNTVGKITFE